MIFLNSFAFTTNRDLANNLVFGKDMNTWLIYTLLFLALTSGAFIWVWWVGFAREKNSGEPIEQPWD